MIQLAPPPPVAINFDTAELYVMTCYHNNYSDWRFPNPIEVREHYIGGWNTTDYPYGYKDTEQVWRVTPVRTI